RLDVGAEADDQLGVAVEQLLVHRGDGIERRGLGSELRLLPWSPLAPPADAPRDAEVHGELVRQQSGKCRVRGRSDMTLEQYELRAWGIRDSDELRVRRCRAGHRAVAFGPPLHFRCDRR